jgi:hypothetical protein
VGIFGTALLIVTMPASTASTLKDHDDGIALMLLDSCELIQASSDAAGKSRYFYLHRRTKVHSRDTPDRDCYRVTLHIRNLGRGLLLSRTSRWITASRPASAVRSLAA